MTSAECRLVTGCDLRIKGDSLKLAWAGLGSACSRPGAADAARRRRAGEGLIFTGRVVGAEEAAAIGLVHDTVPAALTEDAALDLAAHVAAHAPEGVAILKAAFREMDGCRGASPTR